MSRPLEEADRPLWTVGRREACFRHLARRHDAVAENRPVALVVVAEQAGGDVVAAAVPLATPGVNVHLHCALPVCAVRPAGARAVTTRVSNAAHSSSPTACRSGVTSALPIASRRQKWASASGDSAG